MKKLITLFMTAAFIISINAKDLKELVVTTNPPMSCQNCEKKIKGNLRFEKGIKKIETNIPDQRVVIEYDADQTNEAKIEEAFAKINYKVTVVDDEVVNCEEKASECTSACCNANNEANCCKSKNQ